MARQRRLPDRLGSRLGTRLRQRLAAVWRRLLGRLPTRRTGDDTDDTVGRSDAPPDWVQRVRAGAPGLLEPGGDAVRWRSPVFPGGTDCLPPETADPLPTIPGTRYTPPSRQAAITLSVAWTRGFPAGQKDNRLRRLARAFRGKHVVRVRADAIPTPVPAGGQSSDRMLPRPAHAPRSWPVAFRKADEPSDPDPGTRPRRLPSADSPDSPGTHGPVPRTGAASLLARPRRSGPLEKQQQTVHSVDHRHGARTVRPGSVPAVAEVSRYPIPPLVGADAAARGRRWPSVVAVSRSPMPGPPSPDRRQPAPTASSRVPAEPAPARLVPTADRWAPLPGRWPLPRDAGEDVLCLDLRRLDDEQQQV